MYRFINVFRNNSSHKVFTKLRFISTNTNKFQIAKPNLRLKVEQQEHKVTPFGWFLLIIPVSTFALGTWQVQRKKWKEDLIAKLHSLTKQDPVGLPDSLEEIAKLEYRLVHVRGRFLHDKEIYLGPRSLIKDGGASSGEGSLFSEGSMSTGYNVITPFKLSDRDEIILVNRGWVPSRNKNSATRHKGQIEGEVDVIGIVRLNEMRPTFVANNKPDANIWFYRDLKQMCEKTGASPIFLDATNDFDVKGGPIGGQTRISLRNEHLSYILTWYSLCAFTSFLWYKRIWLGATPSNRAFWSRL